MCAKYIFSPKSSKVVRASVSLLALLSQAYLLFQVIIFRHHSHFGWYMLVWANWPHGAKYLPLQPVIFFSQNHRAGWYGLVDHIEPSNSSSSANHFGQSPSRWYELVGLIDQGVYFSSANHFLQSPFGWYLI